MLSSGSLEDQGRTERRSVILTVTTCSTTAIGTTSPLEGRGGGEVVVLFHCFLIVVLVVVPSSSGQHLPHPFEDRGGLERRSFSSLLVLPPWLFIPLTNAFLSCSLVLRDEGLVGER